MAASRRAVARALKSVGTRFQPPQFLPPQFQPSQFHHPQFHPDLPRTGTAQGHGLLPRPAQAQVHGLFKGQARLQAQAHAPAQAHVQAQAQARAQAPSPVQALSNGYLRPQFQGQKQTPGVPPSGLPRGAPGWLPRGAPAHARSSTGGPGSRRYVDSEGVEHFRRRGLQSILPEVVPPPPNQGNQGSQWGGQGGGGWGQGDQGGQRGSWGQGGQGGGWGSRRGWRAYATWLVRHKEAAAAAGAGAVGLTAYVYYSNLETVPYSNRRHFVIVNPTYERALGVEAFKQMKEELKGSVVPPEHPASQRVRRIAQNIIHAACQGLSEDESRLQTQQGPKPHPHGSLPGVIEVPIDWEGRGRQAQEAMAQGGAGEADPWADKGASAGGRKDELLQDSIWLEQKRRSGSVSGVPPARRDHLQGLKWEVLVVHKPILNAFCLPGGKIVVYTGLLANFPEDDQVATILGHEVAHIVARHAAERVSQGFVIGVVQIGVVLLLGGDFNGLFNLLSQLIFALPFSRMHELEADRIGLLLMASAGYDPSVAPSVYERLDEAEQKVTKRGPPGVPAKPSTVPAGEAEERQKRTQPLEYFSTHPAPKRRAALLAKSEAMREAQELYAEHHNAKSHAHKFSNFAFF